MEALHIMLDCFIGVVLTEDRQRLPTIGRQPDMVNYNNWPSTVDNGNPTLIVSS